MSNIIRTLKYLFFLSALLVLGLNFSNPKVGKATLSAIQEPLKMQKLPKAPPVVAPTDPEADAALQQKRYVQIEGKLYEYNPRGVYIVNGVSTMYKNGVPRTWEEIKQERDQAAAAAQAKQEEHDEYASSNAARLKQVEKMAGQGPLSAYTPGGMQKVIDGARAAADSLNQRTKTLDQINE